MKNIVEFLQTGGVPLTNDLMQTLQEAWQLYESFGELSGHLTIISGGEIVGSNVTPGVVAINGEVLPFDGGTISSTVYIHEEQVYKTFQDQQDKILIKHRSVRFGSAATTWNWSDFKKLETIKEIANAAFSAATQQQVNDLVSRIEVLEKKTAPIQNGGIVLAWMKPVSEIPNGWKEAVNWRGKTIIFQDPNDVDFATLGAAMGEKKHALTINELPSHRFSIFGGGGINTPNINQNPNGTAASVSDSPTANSDWNAQITTASGEASVGKTNTLGGNQPHNNLQPSRIALAIEPDF